MDLLLHSLNLGRKRKNKSIKKINNMISTKIIKAKGFWKSVFAYSFIFIVVTTLIRIAIRYKFDFEKFVSAELSEDKIFMFFVSNVLLWIVLGFVLTYFKYKKQMENNSSKK